MDLTTLTIDDDIESAATLPAEVYRDPDVHGLVKDRVFSRSWHLAGDVDALPERGSVAPFSLLPGCLEEPLVLTRGAHDELRCLSNVCTHRGARVCVEMGTVSSLRCPYHGRRFSLDGRLLSAPGFEGAADFPSAADDLPLVPLARWGKLLFSSLDPAFPFHELVAPMDERTGFLPIGRAVLVPERSKDYLVRANWALYCDNYLEGFHIPFVHPSLAGVLETAAYRTELFPWASLQVGVARAGEDSLDVPASSPDHGQRIAAYYFWLFPSTMVNVYPWGLSVNVVKPLGPSMTRVSFLSYVWDPSRTDRGAGAALDDVEMEDEAVVESVQHGVQSRLFRRGRYAPAREAGVHHFHRLLVRFLKAGP